MRQTDEAFEAIYRQNYDRVFAFLQRLTGDWLLAEELTQETFYRAFCSYGSFRGDCQLFTWLAGIGRHVFYHHLRRKRLQLQTVCLDTVADAWCAADPAPGVPQQVERAAVCRALRRLVGQLPPRSRDVVLLRLYAQLPFAQVAAALGISEGSAKVLYCRAKDKLARQLEEMGELEG